jgi:tetratricopeptide (TPR) repeat protein
MKNNSLTKFLLIFCFQIFFGIQVFSQLNVNAYLQSAKNDIDKNNFSEAINKLSLCIQVKPGETEAYFYRGICKYFLNDNLGAKEDFDNAITIYSPLFYDAYHYRSIVKYRLGDYEGSVKDLNKIMSTKNINPQLYSERAFSKLASQDFNGALSDCNKAISMKAISEDIFVCKGVAETALNQFDNALRDYSKALSINPKNAEIYVREGITKSKMGSNQEAIDDYNKALKMDSVSTFAYYSRAEARIAMKDTKGALQDYNMVLTYEPKNSLAYFNRAILEANLKNYKNAISDFDKVLMLNPENIQALFNRANLKRNINDYQGALDDYNKTIELFPYFVEAYYNRAELKKDLHDLRGAKQDEELGKMISEKNYSATGSQRVVDSTTLVHLMALNADFNDAKTDTVSMELMPIFYIALKDSNSKMANDYSPLLLKINNEKNNSFFLTNKEIKNKTAYTDSSREVLKDNDLKIALRLKKAIQKTNTQLFNDAIKGYDLIIEKEPKCAIAYFARGINACREMEMINQFGDEQYILNNKTNPIGKNQKNEKYEKALSDFNKAIELEPTFAFGYFNRAYVKCQLQDFNGAIMDYNKAAEINPDLADAFYNKGVLLFYLKDKLNACQNFSKAGELGLKESYAIIKKYCHQF